MSREQAQRESGGGCCWWADTGKRHPRLLLSLPDQACARVFSLSSVFCVASSLSPTSTISSKAHVVAIKERQQMFVCVCSAAPLGVFQGRVVHWTTADSRRAR
mmetsp:Transcript_3327/g.9665  ORF Transcript_3327/g.9665 Transcript_3327/m.9665 type:complete len:103 (-) Transcript_3327:2469-2777(-)